MDCKTARLLLELHQPDIASDEAAALEAHLVSCPVCASYAEGERRSHTQIARAMQAVPIPPGLLSRVHGRLAKERRQALRRKTANAVVGFAIAAGLLLAVSLVSFWIANNRPAVNLEAQRDRVIEKMASPRPDWLQEWFATQRGVAMVPPTQFNYTFLAHYDMGECQGQRVPQLVFVRDHGNQRTRADVFVVTRQHFNLNRLPPDTSHMDTQGFRVLVFHEDEAPDTAFLIFHNGDSLDPLLVSRPGI